eukprot:6049107-Pyramimonas_sp.AAC.1
MVQGTIGTEMYLLQRGAVDCFLGTEATCSAKKGAASPAKKVMQLTVGSYFGEVMCPHCALTVPSLYPHYLNITVVGNWCNEANHVPPLCTVHLDS